VPPPLVTALGDQVRTHLASGGLDGRGPTDFGADGTIDDAARAARIVLADLDHWRYLEARPDSAVDRATWDRLAEQLRVVLLGSTVPD
jgi:hypothetical protein